MKVESQNEVERPVMVRSPRCPRTKNGKPSGKPARRWWIAVLAFAIVVAIVVSGILPRINARAALDKETAEMAIPTVSVVQAQARCTGAGDCSSCERASLYRRSDLRPHQWIPEALVHRHRRPREGWAIARRH